MYEHGSEEIKPRSRPFTSCTGSHQILNEALRLRIKAMGNEITEIE